jgi:penicillin-binding protein 2
MTAGVHRAKPACPRSASRRRSRSSAGDGDVVNHQRGTAFAPASWSRDGMGGKTGTSQVRRITEEERRTGIRKAHQVPWNHRDHAVFVGFAPIHAPRFAVAVLVEHGGGGSSVAAPIARDILIEAQKRDRQRPDPLQRVAELSKGPGLGS